MEDMALQLVLLVDGGVVTRPVIVPDRKDLCDALLGKVRNKFQSGWMETKWLEDNFGELDEHATILKNE
ncbi:hypothetical protein PVK06_028642 [Gossypium arboreum]|uniref:Uncharacterized protein n=1 Tax=Gossypium arboreum TaxID=29729 RepID=A0ABR0P460_GOSAR|nr:hypothetical protein PVK06_028642 [Gossypium arboreum]